MKVIKMTVLKKDDGKDVFHLLIEPPVDIVLTEDDGTTQLKKMFGVLLRELLQDDVTIEFKKTQEYEVAMYEDVCREYIDVLNNEMIGGRARLKEEKLCP